MKSFVCFDCKKEVVTATGLFTSNKDDAISCGECCRKQYGDDAYSKYQTLIKGLSDKYSLGEQARMVDSFMKIKHVIGPMGLFLPVLDEEFNTLREKERDPADPNKFGRKQNKRLSFLLKEYENALPLIQAALDIGASL